ncbi:hypothetical protein [uncultured Robinsoniella sp.]|uniref:hypothetical protein n=1 Tax=uncultured Robinsoniella sp. TaxID=904190 RepID=UPI00374F870C
MGLAEKRTLCSWRWCTEREGGEPWQAFGRLTAELAFSNLAGVIFGGTRAFAAKS